VTALYLGLNLLYLRTVPLGTLEGSVAVADVAAHAVLGRLGGGAVALVVGFALASGVSAMLLAGPRIYYAMARDGVIPAAFGRVDPASGVPSFGVAAQALWAGVLVLTGAFESLLTYTAFAVVLFSATAVAALFVLRRRPGYGHRPCVRAPGHPWVTSLFLLASAAMLVQAVRFAPGPSLAGASLIAAGIPAYLWTCRRASRQRDAAPPKPEAPKAGGAP
jgi:APA family basic amino acid/polyamine antiporter